MSYDHEKASAAVQEEPKQKPVVKVVAAKGPAETWHAVAESGAAAGRLPPWRIFIMGIFSGSYIAFGGFLCNAILSHCPGEWGLWVIWQQRGNGKGVRG